MSRKEQIKELFTFSSGEKKGIFVLLVILAVIIVINLATDFKKREQVVDFSDFDKEIAEFKAGLKERGSEDYVSRLDKFIIERYDSLTLFNFNPNTTTDDEWIRLGMTDKQISTIKNYMSKGGKFYDKDDFRKMYGIRTKQFEILKPYIQLPDDSPTPETDYRRYDRNIDYEKREKKYDGIPEDYETFSFNPNSATEEEWIRLGFTEKQIGTIQNYLKKGGKFRKPEDLEKIYGIKPEQYQRIKDNISIPTSIETDEKKSEKTDNPISLKQVDINSLSVEEFTALGGFWKYNAAKIVKFRNELGGFLYKEQLLDIKGLKQEYYERVVNQIIVGKIEIKQIRINFADEKELSAHPYLEWHNAKDIIEFRDKHGNITDVNILREKKVLSKTTFDKLKPYITVK